MGARNGRLMLRLRLVILKTEFQKLFGNSYFSQNPILCRTYTKCFQEAGVTELSLFDTFIKVSRPQPMLPQLNIHLGPPILTQKNPISPERDKVASVLLSEQTRGSCTNCTSLWTLGVPRGLQKTFSDYPR